MSTTTCLEYYQPPSLSLTTRLMGLCVSANLQGKKRAELLRRLLAAASRGGASTPTANDDEEDEVRASTLGLPLSRANSGRQA